MDTGSFIKMVEDALTDPRFRERLERTRDGECPSFHDIWMVYNIAPADSGQYQVEEAAGEFDLEGIVAGDEYAWNTIDEVAEVAAEEIRGQVTLPRDVRLSFGHWTEGGCYGLILGYAH